MSHGHYFGPPATLFTEAFRRETEKGLSLIGPSSIHNALVLALPSGTVNWGAGVSSAAKGLFLAKVVADGWSELEFGVPFEGNDLGTVTLEVTIFDADRSFSREVAKYGRTLRGIAVTYYRVSPNVPDPDAFTRFAGVLDSYSEIAPLHWRLRMRPDDLPIRAEAGVSLPRTAITQADWSAAHADALGKYLGPVYGTFDSNGSGREGFIPTLYVDTVNFRYAWQIGRGTVQAAYRDNDAGDRLIIPASEYTVEYPTVNGKTFSVVKFDEDQEDAVISLDVEGLTTKADGTGTLITNPIRQGVHLFTQFVWNDWRGPREYFDDSASPFDLASIEEVAQICDDVGLRGSFRMDGTEQTKADAVLRGWIESFGPILKAWWTNKGKLALGFLDFRPSRYQSEQIYWEEDMRGGPPVVRFPVESITREVAIEYVFDHFANQYRHNHSVADLAVRENVRTARTQPWTVSKVVA